MKDTIILIFYMNVYCKLSITLFVRYKTILFGFLDINTRVKQILNRIFSWFLNHLYTYMYLYVSLYMSINRIRKKVFFIEQTIYFIMVFCFLLNFYLLLSNFFTKRRIILRHEDILRLHLLKILHWSDI